MFHTKLVQLSLAWLTILSVASADDAPASPNRTRHQVTGLFSKDREQDLRDVFEKLPDFKLIAVDFEFGEATLEYDAAKTFPGAKSEQIIERLDNMIRGASNHAFGIKPLCSLEREKLKRIEIPIVGLDCKACSLAAYEIVYRLPGVECAKASFKEGKVTALVNPEKTDRVELEMALKQRGVQIGDP